MTYNRTTTRICILAILALFIFTALVGCDNTQTNIDETGTTTETIAESETDTVTEAVDVTSTEAVVYTSTEDDYAETTTEEESSTEVTTPFTFVLDITDATVLAGDELTFTVTVTGGTAPYTYKWWTESEHQVLSENVLGDETVTLTLKNIAPEQNESLVWCVVTDHEGNSITSAKAKLTVENPFRVAVQPVNIEMKYGKYAPFRVTVAGGKAPYVFFLQMSENGEDGWYDVEYGDTCQDDPACGVMNSPKASCYYRFRIVDDWENGEEIFSDKAYVTVNPA